MPPLTVQSDKGLYDPGEVAHVTTNAAPPYTITASVRGVVVGTSTDEPLNLSVLLAWSGEIIVFGVTHGEDYAGNHAHVT